MKFRDYESESWSSEDSDEDEVEQVNELSEVNSSEKEEEEDINDEEDSSEQSFSVGAVGKFPTKPIGGEIICFVPLLYIPGRGDLFMPPEPRDNRYVTSPIWTNALYHVSIVRARELLNHFASLLFLRVG